MDGRTWPEARNAATQQYLRLSGLHPTFTIAPRPPIDVIVASASGIFAKLLLAGADGVAGAVRVDENTARNRIVERLQQRLQALDASVVIEHHMAQGNRCDFTAAKMIDGQRRLLVCEVKGQWHAELYTAAAEQLDKRYASHPDAARQGIYLALWFGPDEKIANRKRHSIKSAQELRTAILEKMPLELHGFVDVFVLDLSKT